MRFGKIYTYPQKVFLCAIGFSRNCILFFGQSPQKAVSQKAVDVSCALLKSKHSPSQNVRICQSAAFSLAILTFLCYKWYLISAMNGKITVSAAKRGLVTGCKPDCGGAVWFARELPWRHGRPAHRYRGVKCVPSGANLGGTAEGTAFRPNNWDGGFFCCLPPEAIEISTFM